METLKLFFLFIGVVLIRAQNNENNIIDNVPVTRPPVSVNINEDNAAEIQDDDNEPESFDDENESDILDEDNETEIIDLSSEEFESESEEESEESEESFEINRRYCGENEEYSRCDAHPMCQTTCSTLANSGIFCRLQDICREGCICRDGYVRNSFYGMCIPRDRCPQMRF